jgi:hypothetical protein
MSEGPLIDAARTIGSAVGKIVSAARGGGVQPAPAGTWSAEYIGSGTFIIHKPKRKSRKLRQTRLHSRKPGMRK